MASPSTVTSAEIAVEYDRGRTGRTIKTFDCPYKARRFYAQKDKLGKNPRVIGGRWKLPAEARKPGERTGRRVAASNGKASKDTGVAATTQEQASAEGQRHYTLEGLIPKTRVKQFKWLVETTINVRVNVLRDLKYGYTSFELQDADLVLTGRRHKMAVKLMQAIEYGLNTEAQAGLIKQQDEKEED